MQVRRLVALGGVDVCLDGAVAGVLDYNVGRRVLEFDGAIVHGVFDGGFDGGFYRGFDNWNFGCRQGGGCFTE